MKRLLLALFGFLGHIFLSYGGEVKTIETNLNKGYKRSGNTVWFIKEKVIDSLICLPGESAKCMVGTTTLYFADVYNLVGNVPDTALKRISAQNNLISITYGPNFKTKFENLVGQEEKLLNICKVDHKNKVISFEKNVVQSTTKRYGILVFTFCFLIFSSAVIFYQKIRLDIQRKMFYSSYLFGFACLMYCLMFYESRMPFLVLVLVGLIISLFLMDQDNLIGFEGCRNTERHSVIWLVVFPFAVWLATQDVSSFYLSAVPCGLIIFLRFVFFIKDNVTKETLVRLGKRFSNIRR